MKLLRMAYFSGRKLSFQMLVWYGYYRVDNDNMGAEDKILRTNTLVKVILSRSS